MRKYELHDLDLSESGMTLCGSCPLNADGCSALPKRINSHLYSIVDCSSNTVKLAPDYKTPISESELISALDGLMQAYKSMADSGDCGNWIAEDQKEYKAALAAINNARN